MNIEEDKTNKSSNKENSLSGYPHYSDNEDIYNNEKKAPNINPDDDSEITEPNDEVGILNEKNDDRSGSDLDVPGSELDDSDEAIGEEDEENNSYSIGGDNHINLEENSADQPTE